MLHSPLEYLRHMRDEAEYLAETSAGLTRETFLQDTTLQRAFVRSIEVIGEASKKVTPDIKDRYQELNWKAIAGMRDRLIHDYFGIDYEIVWDVVENKIPPLLQAITDILTREGHNGAVS